MECVEIAGIHVCRQWLKDVLDPNAILHDKDSKKWFYDVEMLQTILEKAIKNGELKNDTPVVTLTHILLCE